MADLPWSVHLLQMFLGLSWCPYKFGSCLDYLPLELCTWSSSELSVEACTVPLGCTIHVVAHASPRYLPLCAVNSARLQLRFAASFRSLPFSRLAPGHRQHSLPGRHFCASVQVLQMVATHPQHAIAPLYGCNVPFECKVSIPSKGAMPALAGHPPPRCKQVGIPGSTAPQQPGRAPLQQGDRVLRSREDHSFPVARFSLCLAGLILLVAAHAGYDRGLLQGAARVTALKGGRFLGFLEQSRGAFQATFDWPCVKSSLQSFLLLGFLTGLRFAAASHTLQTPFASGLRPLLTWCEHQACVIPLMWLGLGVLALCKLLCVPLIRKPAFARRFLIRPLQLVPDRVAYSIGASASPHCCILRWTASGKPRRTRQASPSSKSCLRNTLFLLFGFMNLPEPVSATMPGAWYLPLLGAAHLPCSFGMEAADAAASSYTGPTAADPVGTTEGVVDGLPWPLMYGAGGHNREPVLAVDMVRLPQALGETRVDVESGWLGVIILAPHCQPTTWAFGATFADTSVTLLTAVENLGPALYHGFFNAAVPVVPQRYPNYASVLAYNTVFAHVGAMGHVPVVIDLSRVGGSYYATMLPCRLPYRDLYDYVRPQLGSDVAGLLFFVGEHATPCQPLHDVVLEAGEAIMAQHAFDLPIHPWKLSHLFRPGATWGPLHHIPREGQTPTQAPGFCVMHARHRYVIQQQRFATGLMPVEAVGQLLGVEPASLTMHVHATPADLDVQGSACAAVISVVDLPKPDLNCPVQRLRRDVFVLCDLRPLGLRPFAFHSHSLLIHIPTILALAEVRIFFGYRLQIQGGQVEGHEVRVAGSTTLVFRTQAVSEVAAAAPDDPPSPDLDDDDEGDSDEHDSQPSSAEHRSSSEHGWPTSAATSTQELRPGGISPPGPDAAIEVCLAAASLCLWSLPTLKQPCFWSSAQSHALATFEVCAAAFPACLLSGPAAKVLAADAAPTCKGPDQPTLGELTAQPLAAQGLLETRMQQDRQDRDPLHIPVPEFAVPPPELLGALPAQAARVNFVVYVPRYQPEVWRTMLHLPCDPLAALQGVEAIRAGSAAYRFPVLHFTAPQLSDTFVSLIAVPVWLTEQVVVLLDCRPYNGVVFCEAVTPWLRREDILYFAGVGSGACMHVFWGSNPEPLLPQALVQPMTGDVFTVAFYGAVHTPGPDIVQALQHRHTWQEVVVPPGHQDPALWLLTDMGEDRFSFHPRRRSQLRHDVAYFLGYAVRSLTLRAATPHIRDHANRGWDSSAVVVATQRYARTAGRPAGHQILILDLRPLLRDIGWQLVQGDSISLAALERRFQAACPDGFILMVLGGRPETREDDTLIHLEDGQVLILEFMVRFDQQDAHGPDSDLSDGDDSNTPTSDAPSTDEAGSDAESLDASMKSLPRSEPNFSGSEHQHTISAPAESRSTCAKFSVPPSGQLVRGTRFGLFICWIHCLMQPLLAVQLSELGTPLPVTHQPSSPAPEVMWIATACDQPPPSGTVHDTPVLAAEPMWKVCDTRRTASRHRPMPTPCRSNRHPTVSLHDDPSAVLSSLGVDANQVPGPTLLEEAVRHPANTAYFEARVLLSALKEYFSEIEQSAEPSPSTRPTSLSLDALVPPTSFQQSALDLQDIVPARCSGTSPDLAFDWLDVDLKPYLRSRFATPEWRAFYASMLTWHTNPSSGALRAFLLYTDGSASNPTDSDTDILPAAWAFAVWAVCDTGLYFVGASTHTAAPPGTPYHVGEMSDDSLTAELLALTWALSWALEHGARHQVPLEFRYDSTAAGLGVFGAQRLPTGGSDPALQVEHTSPSLAAFAAQLRIALAQRVQVQHSHVKGHSGEPGNELCDILSKYSRHGPVDYYDRCLPSWPGRWFQHDLWQWGWLTHHSSPALPTLPALEAEARRMQLQTVVPEVPRHGLHKQQWRAAQVTYHVTAVTYNVLTLYDPGAPWCSQKRQEAEDRSRTDDGRQEGPAQGPAAASRNLVVGLTRNPPPQ